MNPLEPSSSATKYALLNYEAPGSRRKVVLIAPKIFCPDEDSLPTVKAQIDYFSQAHPFELIELFEGKEENETPHLLYPIEIVALLARDEFAIRGNQEKGLNPERHEPLYAMAAMEGLLKKRRIPSEILTHPESLVEDTANTGSARLFNLLLENGVKPNFGKTRETLKAFWKECIRDFNTHIKNYGEQNAAQNNLPQWSLEGLHACTGNLMANFKRMDFSLRTYDQVHRFIGLLRERVYDRRQEKLLAELEAEASAPKKLSKSAKRKARQKAHREQKAPIKPPSLTESVASGSGGLLGSPPGNAARMDELPIRSAAPMEEACSRSVSPIPDDTATLGLRELREKMQRLLPTQADRDELRSRVQSLKTRMERLEDRIEALKARYSNMIEP